jgi:hypothetical protein
VRRRQKTGRSGVFYNSYDYRCPYTIRLSLFGAKMGVTECSVCSKTSKECVVHRARSKNRRYAWMSACAKASVKIKNTKNQICICEEHFEVCCYFCAGTLIRLKEDALPTIFSSDDPSITFESVQVKYFYIK